MSLGSKDFVTDDGIPIGFYITLETKIFNNRKFVLLIMGVTFNNTLFNMWRDLRKPALWRVSYRRPWPDDARNAQRLVRAYDICRSWLSTVNIFVSPYAVLTIINSTHVWKQLIYDDIVCSTIRQVFADVVTYTKYTVTVTFTFIYVKIISTRIYDYNVSTQRRLFLFHSCVCYL